MSPKRIISLFFIAFTVLVSSNLLSCEEEDWCSDCNLYDCRDIFYEKILDTETVCARNRAECKDAITSFHVEHLTTCWDCSEPYRK